MNNRFILIASALMMIWGVAAAQTPRLDPQQRQQIHALIDTYSQAREQQDRGLMESILTNDIDQLVSSGEWRKGKTEAMQGMTVSSVANPGTRTLTVENVRLLNDEVALVDARYDIRNAAGVTRHMWSTFITVRTAGKWKISAIRNMLPAARP